ncbi:hypothetical protein JCM33374_g1915 [Metschnikowia sp. JCM 33374]|nr:hypothetical protein JCM33374_g1915 [Metschnikowia sp. JCM 33374]
MAWHGHVRQTNTAPIIYKLTPPLFNPTKTTQNASFHHSSPPIIHLSRSCFQLPPQNHYISKNTPMSADFPGPAPNVPEDDSVTAVDYLETQLQLEKEAREAMPYEPDTCTYPQTLRQLVFACLTCSRANKNAPVGVCYSCSIQCHSTHELVELFSKRNFVCDCGTCRMQNGSACAIRTRQNHDHTSLSRNQIPRMRSGSVSAGVGSFSSSSSSSRPFSSLSLPSATDIESSGNSYNQNFAGKFCSCEQVYNPIQETQTMHQCYLGDACGEDWFHQECILGYEPGIFHQKAFVGTAENKLDDLPPPGMDAASETVAKLAKEPSPDPDAEPTVPHFPDLSSFGEFICWKCVAKHKDAFDDLCGYTDIVVSTKPHFAAVPSADAWFSLNTNLQGEDKNRQVEDDPPAKRQKLHSFIPGSRANGVPYSVFLAENTSSRLLSLKSSLPPSPLRKLLTNFDFLVNEDPIYQPEEDDVASNQASEGSLYDLGSNALSSLPIPQALEGLQAYDVMKEKLQGFFKDFVDQKKVVTEEEVRDFFGKMKEK